MSAKPRIIAGRYELHGAIASGGMATVYFGRMRGPRDFTRVVAIKQLHPHLATDERVVTALWDEARLAAQVNHPNVVATIEILEDAGDVFLVLEHVHGVSLAALAKAGRTQGSPMPTAVVSSLIGGVLAGLHAAHEANGANGLPLGLVHRDVSPQNILVGVDGLPRVIDFGIAKAAGRAQQTETGQLKGKLSYMAPEQLRNVVDRRTDVFAAGIITWELLTSRRLFDFDEAAAITHALDHGKIDLPSRFNTAVSPALDAVVMKALARRPDDRWPSARAMATALDEAEKGAPTATVAAYVGNVMRETLLHRTRALAAVQSGLAQEPSAHSQGSPDLQTETVGGGVTSTAGVTKAKRSKAPAYLTLAGFALVLGGVSLFALQERPATAVKDPVADAPLATAAHRVRTTPLAAPAPTVAVDPPPPPVAKQAPQHKAPKPTPKPTKRKAPDCDPPYWLDASGVRKPKPQCL